MAPVAHWPWRKPALELVPSPSAFVWDRTHTLALADIRCVHCFGAGLRGRNLGLPCGCVTRRIFRQCLNRYRLIDQGYYWRRHRHFGVMPEDYAADFCLVSRRTLTAKQWAVFRLHFLDGQTWAEVCAQLGMNRGNFFHEVYRIEDRLGRAFREIKPYALHPIAEYFTKHRQ